MQRIQIVDEALLVENRDAVLSNENELGMRDDELLTVSRANCKRAKAAT